MLKIVDLRGTTRSFEDVEEAARVLEEEGQVPAEYVRMFLADQEAREIDPVLWPSRIDPATTCRREMVLGLVVGRLDEGDLHPFDMRRTWERFTGIGLETALETGKPEDTGRVFYQLAVPDGLVENGLVPADHPALVEVSPSREGEQRFAVRSDVLGGALFRGRLDRLTLDDGAWAISDWKVTGFPGPGRDWGLSDSWVLQVQLYAHLLRVLLPGVEKESLTIWRIYRDPYVWMDQGPGQRKRKMADVKVAFRRYDLEPWDDATLAEKIGEFVTSCKEILEQLAEHPEDWVEILADIPMDGEEKGVYGGKKCERYCDYRDTCFRLAGRPAF